MMPFRDEAEAIALANDSDYGLTAWVQTRDVTRMTRIVTKLRAGNVMVNPGPNTVSCAIPPSAVSG